MGMTKAELVDHVATTVQLPKNKTEAVITAFLQGIVDSLQAGVVYPNSADNCLAPTARYNAPISHRCEGALPWCRTCFSTNSH